MKVFSTCPHSRDIEPARYLRAVADVARWSEAAGCAGILVYTDNSLLDPWVVSQIILQSTDRLAPLVALQPVYQHPYAAAKLVTSLAFLHGRPVALNLVAGGFKNDLEALGDETPHDDRYARATEYARIMMGLLRDECPVTARGRFYNVTNLRLTPPLPDDLLPELLMSGSSPAGLAAARALGATPVRYPQPVGEEPDTGGDPFGVRVGIIARPSAEDAWRVARERFPDDRAGRITHTLAMRISDSHWHHQLSTRQDGVPAGSGRPQDEPDPYWLGPFQNYKTFCPYLVGSYDRVAEEITRYVVLGATTFILDIPASEEELDHVGIVFGRCQPAGLPA